MHYFAAVNTHRDSAVARWMCKACLPTTCPAPHSNGYKWVHDMYI